MVLERKYCRQARRRSPPRRHDPQWMVGARTGAAGDPLAPAPQQTPAACTRKRSRQSPAPSRSARAAPLQTAPAAQGVIQAISVRGQPASRAGDDSRLRQPGAGPDIHRGNARYGAEGSLRDRAVLRRRHHGRRRPATSSITVQENPVVNRIILEGNKRIKDDKILPEIKLKPREIFTRSKVRADVDRIIELYKRQGRFAARVEPEDRQPRAEPRRPGLRGLRRRQVQGSQHQHHRQRGVQRRTPAQGDVHAAGRRSAWLPEVERQLRSRPACGRPAEASRLLSDPGLRRFPRRLGACRPNARSQRLRHHLRRSRKGPAIAWKGPGRERFFATFLPRRSRRC